MLIKKIGLCMLLGVFLAGCGSGEKNVITNDEKKQEISSEEKQEADLSKEDEVPLEDKVNNNPQSDQNQKNEKSDLTSKEKTSENVNVSNPSNLSTKAISWSWLYSPRDNADLLAKYGGYGFGDTSKKVIYLTFDEGYENGYTSSILDTLKANNVHAAFFVTKPYVMGSFNGVSDAELLKRMIKEGHIIGNHSVQHKSMPTFTDETAFDAEIIGVEDAVNRIPGCKMSKYFRPPEGTFSELSLYYTKKMGYESIFFALAYQDYDIENQPSPEAAKLTLIKNTRNGMICLLHAVSKTNATILDSLIKEWKSQGYEFKTLDELPT